MENNFTIIFNNNKYEVNKELLFYYSPELKNKIESQNSNSIDLSDSSFLDSSFASFIDACQSRPYSINTSNFHDFCNLSFIYKVQHLIEECDEFQKHSQFVDLLIPHLFSKIRKHKDPQTLIKQIATHFIELQQRKDILTIPHEYLEQIITTSLNYKTDQSLIFKFLITKYEENEKIAPLFQKLDPNKLTVYELKWILDHPEINTDFITSCFDINQKVKTINDQINERQEKIDNYEKSLKELLNSDKYQHVSKKIKKIREKYIKKNESDDKNADSTENVIDSDILQIEQNINSLFGTESGIHEFAQSCQYNETQIPYITENMAEDLKYNLYQTLQLFDEFK